MAIEALMHVAIMPSGLDVMGPRSKEQWSLLLRNILCAQKNWVHHLFSAGRFVANVECPRLDRVRLENGLQG